MVSGTTRPENAGAPRCRFNATSAASQDRCSIRIDIHVDVPAVKFRELAGEPAPGSESSAEIRERVIHARERQCQRLLSEKIFSNAAMTPRMIRRHCRIDTESEQMLEHAMTRLGLSARAYDRILKVSRTIADLAGCDKIQSTHVAVRTSLDLRCTPLID